MTRPMRNSRGGNATDESRSKDRSDESNLQGHGSTSHNPITKVFGPGLFGFDFGLPFPTKESRHAADLRSELRLQNEGRI
jgi:hypothetical protein